MNLDAFTIPRTACLLDALERVEQNSHGIVMVTNEHNKVVGLVTDGDIRRKLIEGVKLDDCIQTVMNPDFIWAREDTSREKILKQLDQTIRVIPLLNRDHQLVNIVTRDHFPSIQQNKIYARAKAPVRVSFVGGGSDVTHYFSDSQGAVINSTITVYSHATLRMRTDSKVIVHSYDYNEKVEAESVNDFLEKNTRLTLFQALVKVILPEHGFELFVNSDFPPGSGLGGSSAVAAAILGCFNEFRQDKWDQHEIAELAFQAERLYLGIAGGWQDQYATVFGGFNFMEFRMDQNIIHPLRISSDVIAELEECLILCDTEISHESGMVHNDQRRQMKKDDIKLLVQDTVEMTYEMRNHLFRGRLQMLGELLDKAWNVKRQLSDKISTPLIDELYARAKENGVIGGKLLGAGGGGFFLFFVPPFQKYKVIDWLKTEGYRTKAFSFESNGLQSWTARDCYDQST